MQRPYRAEIASLNPVGLAPFPASWCGARASLSTSGGRKVKKVDSYDAFQFFSRSEFSNPDAMDAGLLFRLDAARRHARVPFVITSSFRAGDERSHGRGLAVDISAVTSDVRYRILSGCLAAGFTRIGVYPRHIHVDVDPDLVGSVIWLGQYNSFSVGDTDETE